MTSEDTRRGLVPLPEATQVTLRRLIRAAASAEDAARQLRLPTASMLAGAAGARLAVATRRRINLALRAAGENRLQLIPGGRQDGIDP
jgi:hypothetical protein